MSVSVNIKVMSFRRFIAVYWPFIFFCLTVSMVFLVDADAKPAFPPVLDLTGNQIIASLLSPWFLTSTMPVFYGAYWLKKWAPANGVSDQDHCAMLWWLVNGFWFHVGCDVFSGLYQVQPQLTELYKHMTPAHHQKMFSPERYHLDGAYVLEMIVEAPLALYVFWLYVKKDVERRKIAEIFALAVQFAGTITYYAPPTYHNDYACWISYVDRLCGSVWILYPLFVFWRELKPFGSSSKTTNNINTTSRRKSSVSKTPSMKKKKN